MIASRGWQLVTSFYCEGDRALAGLLREAVEFPSMEALKRVFGHGAEQLVLGGSAGAGASDKRTFRGTLQPLALGDPKG